MLVSSQPTPRSGLVFRPLSDEWVVLDPTGKRLHVMNLTAALVWGHIDGSRTRAELIEIVWDSFGRVPDRSRVAREVEGVLLDFDRRGLLETKGTVQ